MDASAVVADQSNVKDDGKDKAEVGELSIVSSSPNSDTDDTSDSSDVCRLSMGQVCICATCESTRKQMLKTRALSRTKNSLPAAKRRRTTTTNPSLGTSDDVQNDEQADAKVAVAATVAVATSTESSQDNEKSQKMQQACRTILESIGEDPDREGLIKTPQRWAKALLFMTQGYCQSVDSVTRGAIFAEDHHEMVLVRNIDVYSLCEHHMVPFCGRVHIGYIPNGKVLGLSKLARIAEVYARRLQVQERLTRQICEAIHQAVHPRGVMVMVECTHFCMVMRGVQKTGTSTVTTSVKGCFESSPQARSEFTNLVQQRGGGASSCMFI